ncbi:MAG: hypothetical protein SH850_02245 [Planctomycetaceae bacterium]|nr:hypothetical protein [Planctomycetaceae bacterium]
MIQRSPADPEDIARRGNAIYDQRVAPQVTTRNPQDYVVIDVDSGDFEVAEKSLVATKKLRERRPAAVMWGRYVGTPISVRFGVLR